MRTPVVLITGAAGEIGHGLIRRLSKDGSKAIVTVDLRPLDESLAGLVDRHYTGSIVDRSLLDGILVEYEVDTIYHLAALLSTRSEFNPAAAHQVNVEGTIRLLEFAHAEGAGHGRPVTFLYPSSIAAYGLPDLATKNEAGRIGEWDFNLPRTMYGCNKLYCEHLGRYYAHHYRQLDAERREDRIDFRSLRFPGLMSADTVPSGGTSDYAPEMVHAAAKGNPYACFVRPDTRIPFMAMPDAINALLALAASPGEKLGQTVYNISAFAATAGEIRSLVLESFPDAELTFDPDERRQAIVDSWPAEVNDDAAKRDWGFAPRYGFRETFVDYLVPGISN